MEDHLIKQVIRAVTGLTPGDNDNDEKLFISLVTTYIEELYLQINLKSPILPKTSVSALLSSHLVIFSWSHRMAKECFKLAAITL